MADLRDDKPDGTPLQRSLVKTRIAPDLLQAAAASPFTSPRRTDGEMPTFIGAQRGIADSQRLLVDPNKIVAYGKVGSKADGHAGYFWLTLKYRDVVGVHGGPQHAIALTKYGLSCVARPASDDVIHRLLQEAGGSSA